MRNIISDNKLRQPCAKPEDILNASIQVIICMTFEVLTVSVYRHSALICDKSVTTQNLAFLSYWCNKKCLQMHI